MLNFLVLLLAELHKWASLRKPLSFAISAVGLCQGLQRHRIRTLHLNGISQPFSVASLKNELHFSLQSCDPQRKLL